MKEIISFTIFFQTLFLFSQNKHLDGLFENNSKNIVQLLDRKLLKDTLTNDVTKNYSKFEIKIIDKNKLIFTLINDIDSSKIERIYKYKVENDECLLKNKNTKPLLIPYIAGSIDKRKLYLSIDKNDNLIIRTVESRSGAVLLIGFLDWKTKQNNYIYNRIK